MAQKISESYILKIINLLKINFRLYIFEPNAF